MNKQHFYAGLGSGIVLDDVTRYLITAGITDPAISADVRWFVQALKGAGLWDKIQALWPVLGGTATSHAVNLKAPDRFRLVFADSDNILHNANGMAAKTAHPSSEPVHDGTDSFADTGFNLATDMPATAGYGLHYYTNNLTSLASANDSVEMGVYGDPETALIIGVANSGAGGRPIARAPAGVLLQGSSSGGAGFYSVQTNPAGTAQLAKNAVVESAATGTAAPPLSASVFLLAMRYGPGDADMGYGYSARPCQCAAITENLSSSDLQTLYSLVQQLETRRSRAA